MKMMKKNAMKGMDKMMGKVKKAKKKKKKAY